MRKPWLLSAYLLLSACGLYAQTSSRIGSSAVWQPPAQFQTTVNAACGKPSGAQFVECLATQMSKAGAGADAVQFARELYKLRPEAAGVMTSFESVGPVDIARVTYFDNANGSYGLLLVNGQPRIVNAEDLKLLDTKTMERSFQFQDTKNQFPKAGVWPGARSGTTWPNSQAGQNGGVQFLVTYPLRNGCATCANAGSAIFTWNFSREGKFQGTTFLGMTPPPL